MPESIKAWTSLAEAEREVRESPLALCYEMPSFTFGEEDGFFVFLQFNGQKMTCTLCAGAMFFGQTGFIGGFLSGSAAAPDLYGAIGDAMGSSQYRQRLLQFAIPHADAKLWPGKAKATAVLKGSLERQALYRVDPGKARQPPTVCLRFLPARDIFEATVETDNIGLNESLKFVRVPLKGRSSASDMVAAIYSALQNMRSAEARPAALRIFAEA